MRVQYCSDLHLEFRANRNWLKSKPLIPSGDILVIAGDTYLLDQDFSDIFFFDYVSENYSKYF